jgi:catabolite regulation protein CreA
MFKFEINISKRKYFLLTFYYWKNIMDFLNTRDLIKLRYIQDKQMQNLWCESQQKDIEEIIRLMENVASAALSCSNVSGNMGQDLLKHAKQDFVEGLISAAENYRFFEQKNNLSSNVLVGK